MQSGTVHAGAISFSTRSAEAARSFWLPRERDAQREPSKLTPVIATWPSAAGKPVPDNRPSMSVAEPRSQIARVKCCIKRIRRHRVSAKDKGAGKSRRSADLQTSAVGYGQPPVASRFKPGTSVNPKGRPKGAKNLKTLIREAMI